MEKLLAVEQVTVPPMPCSFPLKCHPDLAIIEETLNPWILSRFNPSSDPEEAKLIIQSKYPLFAAFAFANCDAKRCITVGKFLSWVCLLEDSHDNTPDHQTRTDLSASDKFFDGLIAAVAKNEPSAAEEGFVGHALEWWAELCKDLPAPQQSRCLHLFKSFVLGWKTWNNEVASRSTQKTPHQNIDAYLAVCRQMSAAPFCFVLLEYCLGIELHEKTLNHPLMKELHLAITDHLSLVYELVMLKGQYCSGEFGSLPFVIYFQEGNDLQKSVLRVCDMVRERDDIAARLMEEIKNSPELGHVEGLDRYLDGLGNWMAANIHWSYVTARYLGVDEEAKSPHEPLLFVFNNEAEKPHASISTLAGAPVLVN